MVSELKLWSNESFPEKVKLLVMPRHKELFRDVEREKKKKRKKVRKPTQEIIPKCIHFLEDSMTFKRKENWTDFMTTIGKN